MSIPDSYLALKTLQYKPPLGLFGRIVTGADGAAPNTFNIKDAMLPIINFARLYALKHGLEETDTFSRLERLSMLGVLQEESYRGIYQAYSRLMQLCYQHQVALLKASREPDNAIKSLLSRLPIEVRYIVDRTPKRAGRHPYEF